MPLVIPVFIPHEGCPYSCIFCNQRRISGYAGAPVTAADVARIITTWLARSGSYDSVQVAFYGGSFTGLASERQAELLGAVEPFYAAGQVRTLRLSTRPDYIDASRLELLKRFHVTIVELGVQSMDDTVLAASRRGHGSRDVTRAVDRLRETGLQVGLQLMPGLPGESSWSLVQTTRKAIALEPDFVRIYPALVLEGSRLARLYRRGRYQPLSLAGAVARTTWMKEHFDAAGIGVVRLGLQAGADLERGLVAGPWHPAFGELVAGRQMLKKTRTLLAGAPEGDKVTLSISHRDHSLFRGQRSGNIRRLRQLGLADRFVLRLDPEQPRHTVRCLEAACP